jgi:hypothetical protein
MKRLFLSALLAACLVALGSCPAAIADFGFEDFQAGFSSSDGGAVTQAGSHPFAMTSTLDVNTVEDPKSGLQVPDGVIKDLVVELPPGFVGNRNPVPTCSNADFLEFAGESLPACPNSTAIGYNIVHVRLVSGDSVIKSPVYSLEPPPGVAAKIGFVAFSVPVTVEVGVKSDPPYNLIGRASNISQVGLFFGARLTLWGNPADSAHDPLRGSCLSALGGVGDELVSNGNCPVSIPEKAFLTLPRSCSGPLTSTATALAWNSGKTAAKTATTQGMSGCSKVGFSPQFGAKPTTDHAESPSGLDVNVDVTDEGLDNPDGIALSEIKKAVVTLPKGVTINPSQAEGLAVCSPAQLASERPDSEPGEGCPQASKVGTVEAESPLVEGELLKGSVFVATPFDNPFDSLIAIYIVVKSPELGALVRLAGKVEPDPQTGQLITTVDEVPQIPVSHFRFHFREGGRSPLITPPSCGTYTTKAQFFPWSNPTNALISTSSFQVTRGVGGGPCPPGGPQPFAPGFTAGTINNAAGSYSPFYMRLTRRDGDQDLTKFSATLPPGMVAKLAGVSQCSDAQIAEARAKSGRAELASPSCPANSQIGRALGGAGVGSQLTYVTGKVYLAGPYNGSFLSVVGVVPAVAGPFDVGTVVTRQALQVNPRTAEVRADGSRSDPIPHILAGIPLRVRDIRVYVDRPQFTLNPTNCDPFAVGAELWGGGSDPFSVLDDSPVSRSERFQAADCAALGFKPRLSLQLKGGTRRGGHPQLRGSFIPRAGDANSSGLVLRLPRSAFLDQGHIRTICTRVQFAADSCPAGSVYGHATAYTPLLDNPLQGPVYLRSSDHNLPDIVLDLHGLVDVEAVGRVDSKNGGIRVSFEDLPDAPTSEVVVEMQGGQKGLIVNSRNLCGHVSRADVSATGQNGKSSDTHPQVKPSCKGRKGSRR